MRGQKFNPDSYLPGECNIGKKEIQVRKKFLAFFLPMSILFTVFNFFWPGSIMMWLAMLISSFCALVLINEIRTKFCIIFGFFSLHNFKSLGNLDEVVSPSQKQKDHRRVLRMFVASLAIAFVYSYAIHFLAVKMSAGQSGM